MTTKQPIEQRLKRKMYFTYLFVKSFPRRVMSGLSKASNRVAIEITALAVLAILYPFPDQIPSFFVLSNTSSVIEVFSVIISALATILGIAVAFVLLGFDFGKKYFSWQHSAKRLFESERLRELIVLYIWTIALSLFGLISLSDEEVGDLPNRILYLASILFMIAIGVLIPYARKIVQQDEAEDEIEKLIKDLTINDVAYFSSARGKSLGDNILVGNKFYEILEIARRAFNAQETVVAGRIMEVAFEQFKLLSDNVKSDVNYGGNARDLVYAFASLYGEIAKLSLKAGDLSNLESAFTCIASLHVHYAKQKREWHCFLDIEDVINSIIKQTIKAHYSDLANRMIMSFEQGYKMQITHNSPKQEELWDMSDDLTDSSKLDSFNHDVSNHWRHITDDRIRALSGLGEVAIAEKDEDVCRRVLGTFTGIYEYVLGQDHLGDKQKASIFRYVVYAQEELYDKMLSDDFIRDPALTLGMVYRPHSRNDLAIQGKWYAAYGLQTYARMLITAAKKKPEVLRFSLNELGANGRMLVKNIPNSEMVTKEVIFIADTFGVIRDLMVKDVEDLNKARVYLEVHDQLSLLKDWMDNKKVKSSRVTRKINMELKKFTKLNRAKEISEAGTDDRWTRLFGETPAQEEN